MVTAASLRDAIAGSMWGLLVGDALGVPYEFNDPDDLPPLDQIEMPPPAGFARSHASAPAGAWSDDGAQALCLLASLLDCGRLDLSDLGVRLLRWLDDGYMAVDGMVFDVGMQTREALAALRRGVPLESAAPSDEAHNGNGSLMRVLPLALWHRGSDEELVRDAALQSTVTHAHARSQVCCALYCLCVRATLQQVTDPWSQATARLRALSAGDPVWTSELEVRVCPDRAPERLGSGYVVDCLRSAHIASSELSFERTIKRAVSFGEDTDTTAAVVGGIAGARYGLSTIPARWLAAIPEQELVAELIDRLLLHHDQAPIGCK